MMKWLTLEKIKQQLRIKPGFTAEDTLLEMYGESAEETVLNFLNRSYQNGVETYGKIPMDVVHATLMLVDASYQHRSPASPQNMYYVLYGFDAMIKPYMRLTSQDVGDVQSVPLGSDVKISFTADLPDGLLLKDIGFNGQVINADAKDKVVNFTKADCIMIGDGADYVVLVDTTELGIGSLFMKLTVHIPDTDYERGYRKEVININPKIQVTG